MMQNVALIAHEQAVRNRALRLEADAVQEQPRRIADPVVAGRKRQRVSEHGPQPLPTNPSEMKLIIIVFSAFFDRTSPP